MFEAEFQSDQPDSNSAATDVGHSTKTLEVSNVRTAANAFPDMDVPEKKVAGLGSTAVHSQQPLNNDEIMKLCNSLINNEKSVTGDDGSKVIYIVQTEDVKNHPSSQQSSAKKRTYNEMECGGREDELARNRGFFLEMTHYFDRMNERQLALAKMQIMQVLFESEYGSIESSYRVSSSHSTPKSSSAVSFRDSRSSHKCSKSKAASSVVASPKVYRRECQKKVSSGEYDLVNVVAGDKHYKSKIWQQFARVYNEDTPLDFVACKDCKAVYPYSSTVGTSGILKHSCPNNMETDRKPRITLSADLNVSTNDGATLDDVVTNVADDVDRRQRKFDEANCSTQDKMNKGEVEELLASGQLTLVDESKRPRFKSAIWQKFYRVYDVDIPKDFVSCKECGKVYPYSNQTGTSGVAKHKCR